MTKLKNTPSLYCFFVESKYIPDNNFYKLLATNYGPPELIFENEEHEAVTWFYFIEQLLNKYDNKILNFFASITDGSSHSEKIRFYVEYYIDPIVNYLADQLDESSSVLYLLEKYKLRTEWFFKERLKVLYDGNSSTGENKLDEDLRLFLFDQGLDYPFSTPLSSSGRADIISMLHTDDPLVLEIKIYDEKKGYRKNRISDGFSQIVKYANDYHKNVGYLVVFNMDAVNIEIQASEADKAWPNRVIFEGKNYYIIFINLNNQGSASKAGEIKKIALTIEDLTTNI